MDKRQLFRQLDPTLEFHTCFSCGKPTHCTIKPIVSPEVSRDVKIIVCPEIPPDTLIAFPKGEEPRCGCCKGHSGPVQLPSMIDWERAIMNIGPDKFRKERENDIT